MYDAVDVLCSSCARRDADPDIGFCLECTRTRVTEAYAARDAERSQLNTKRWRSRTGQARVRTEEDRLHDRYRQIRHRRLEQLRPHDPILESTDPMELAYEGLRELSRLRPAAKSVAAIGHLERVAEIVRRLGWGS